MDAPLARTPANCGPKSCFLVSYSPSPTCIPNLKLLASTVAEINRGSQIFFGCSLARTPANFGPNSCFSASYSLSPSCISNLNLLAWRVAEINRGPNILDAPLALLPANFHRKSCFSASYSPSPRCIPNLKWLASTVVTFGRLAVSDSELGVDVIDFDECYCYLFTVLYCSLVLHAGPF